MLALELSSLLPPHGDGRRLGAAAAAALYHTLLPMLSLRPLPAALLRPLAQAHALASLATRPAPPATHPEGGGPIGAAGAAPPAGVGRWGGEEEDAAAEKAQRVAGAAVRGVLSCLTFSLLQ